MGDRVPLVTRAADSSVRDSAGLCADTVQRAGSENGPRGLLCPKRPCVGSVQVNCLARFAPCLPALAEHCRAASC